jgi:hypothetical protein
MEEAGDEPLFRERAAGIDIGKQMVMVTIRETRKWKHSARVCGRPALCDRDKPATCRLHSLPRLALVLVVV